MIDTDARNYIRQGAKRGGIIGGVGMGVLGAAAGGLPKTHTDVLGNKRDRSNTERAVSGAVTGGLSAHFGYKSGRILGGLRNLNKVLKGKQPRPSAPDWLKNTKTRAEGRKAYHAEARKSHPDLHGGSDEKIKSVNQQWKAHEPHYKEAMLAGLADELHKIAQAKEAALGAILGGAAGFKLSKGTLKSKALNTLAGAALGEGAVALARGAKRHFHDDMHHREARDLYGYQPAVNQMPVQGQNFY